MNLHAITLGYAVPRMKFDGSTHSVFQFAANLKLEGEWDLLTLTVSSGADLPRGIRIDTPAGFSFEGLQVGEAVACRNGVIRIPNASIEIDLRKALRWDFDLSACTFDEANPTVGTAWRIVWRALNERQSSYGAEMIAAHVLHPQEAERPLTLRRLADGINQLLTATAGYDLSVSSAVFLLIGLGQGVTPTGDDLLVGYIAGLWCRIGQDARRKEYVSNLGRTLIDLGVKTTDVSRSFLYHAALGHLTSRLAELAEAICKGNTSSELSEKANAAMSMGHTSGMDAVTGLLLGLAAWDGSLLSE